MAKRIHRNETHVTKFRGRFYFTMRDEIVTSDCVAGLIIDVQAIV